MNFGRCLWLVPAATHAWNTIIAQAELGPAHRAHITVHHNLPAAARPTYTGARSAVVKPVRIWSSSLSRGLDDSVFFHAIEMAVCVEGLEPRDGERTHVSLAYRVGPLSKAFTQAEVGKVKRLVLSHRDEGSMGCKDMSLEFWDASDVDFTAWHRA